MPEDLQRQARPFPALSSLALNREHLAALAEQGSLRAEEYAHGRRYFKLRFRLGSKQHVRYVGNDPVFVEQIERELAELQTAAKAARQLRRLTRAAKSCLRTTKRCLAPLLPLAGCRFHGREIRGAPKCRSVSVDCKETLPLASFRRMVMDDDYDPEESVNANQTQPSTAARNTPKPVDQRNERIRELHASVLEVSDPLRAGIRIATADLLEISSLMGSAIKAALIAGKTDLRGIERAMPAINSLTLVHRQTTRYVQLDRDWVAENDPRRDANRRRQLPDGTAGEMES